MSAEVDISTLLQLSFDEQVNYVQKNISDVTCFRSVYELTMANKSLLAIDDIRNRILSNPYHKFSDLREIAELYVDIDITNIRFCLSTLTIDDIDYLINIGYNFDNIHESIFFFIWSHMISSSKIKPFDINLVSARLNRTYQKFAEYILATRTYDEIMKYIKYEFFFIRENHGRLNNIINKAFDNYLCFFFECINDTFCIDILEMPKFQKIIPLLFHDRMNNTIKYLLDKGMTTNHLSYVKIPTPEVIYDFREIQQKIVTNNIDENIIFALEQLYLDKN